MSEPSSKQLEDALREEVARCFTKQDMDNLTLKRIRAVAEEKLDLSSGWFKQHDQWNQKSKTIVNNEVTRRQEESNENDTADEDSEPVKLGKASSTSVTIGKRKSPGSSPKPQKRRRKVQSQPPKPSAEIPATTGDDDSSSLSEVLDPSPPPRGRKEKKTKGKPSTSSPAKSRGKKQSKSATASLSSSETEIKTLQSWLVKCGVRKIWGKELARFDTSSEKIGHLKSLLHDVGMEGRFSEEKAKKIKEARELAADLAEIQQGEKYWGMTGEDEGGRGGRRRLSRAKPSAAAPSESSESVDEPERPEPEADDSATSE